MSAGATTASEPKTFEPLAGRATLAQAALVLALLVDLVAIGSDLLEWRLLGRLEAGELVPDSELLANDDRQVAMGLLQLVALVVTAVFFLLWFHRAYVNLESLGARNLRFGKGWAVGAWFVPVLNLWRPKQIANDLWRASDPDAPADQGETWHGGGVPALLAFWWAAFLLAGWTVVAGSPFDAETVADLKRTTLSYLASDSLDAVAAVLAVVVVRWTSARQELRAERLARERIGLG